MKSNVLEIKIPDNWRLRNNGEFIQRYEQGEFEIIP